MKKKEQAFNTKLKLALTLKNRMTKVPFNKISVTELIEECGCNRKTFYYHFQDTRELLHWYLEIVIEESLPEYFEDNDDYENALQTIIDYVKENERFVTNVYEAIGREGLKKMFKNRLSYISRKVIADEEQKQKIKLSKEHEDLMAIFFTEALGGVVIDIFLNHEGNFSDDFCRYIINVISVSLSTIVKEELK